MQTQVVPVHQQMYSVNSNNMNHNAANHGNQITREGVRNNVVQTVHYQVHQPMSAPVKPSYIPQGSSTIY